jgi:hypothetical protein
MIAPTTKAISCSPLATLGPFRKYSLSLQHIFYLKSPFLPLYENIQGSNYEQQVYDFCNTTRIVKNWSL